MNSRSHKHSIIGSRRESWSHRPWSVGDVIAYAMLCNKPAYLVLVYPNLPGYGKSMFGQPPTYRLCANGPYVDWYDAP